MKKITVIAVVLVVVAVGAFLLLSKNMETPTPPVALDTSSPQVAAVLNEQNIVTLSENGFSPASITVKVGESVVWENMSGSMATIDSNPHPVHTSYEPLNLGEFPDGRAISLTFSQAGTYNYHNHLNSSQTGTIIVE